MTNEALEAALNIQSLLDTGNKREEFSLALDDSNFWGDVRLVVKAVLEEALTIRTEMKDRPEKEAIRPKGTS